MRTSYLPTGSASTRYLPASSVLAVRTTSVSRFFTFTAAWTTGALAGSVTTPRILADTCACAAGIRKLTTNSAITVHRKISDLVRAQSRGALASDTGAVADFKNVIMANSPIRQLAPDPVQLAGQANNSIQFCPLSQTDLIRIANGRI